MSEAKAGRIRDIAVWLGAIALLQLCTASPGDARSLRAKLQPYCMSDYLRLCRATDTSRAKVAACFERNVAQVSGRCKQAIRTHTEFDPDRIARCR